MNDDDLFVPGEEAEYDPALKYGKNYEQYFSERRTAIVSLDG